MKKQTLIVSTLPTVKCCSSELSEPPVETVKAASLLAKAAELCYVKVGDGKQQLCSAQFSLSLHIAELSASITHSVKSQKTEKKKTSFLLKFYQETSKNT